jgi:hypothetical protein
LTLMMFTNSAARFFWLLALAGNVEAFAPARLATTLQKSSIHTPFRAATIEGPTTTINGKKDEPTTWECDDELTKCVEVPACDEEVCRTSLDVRIHGEWYDLTG